MTEKKDIRKQILAARGRMTEMEIREKSLAIRQKIFSLNEYKTCRLLLSYASYRNETDTSYIIQKALSDGKEVALPKIEGRRMVFYKIQSPDDLKPGTMGIPEPPKGRTADGEEALMIMPGIAFDRQLHRIGYGGGFYDRYLSVHTNLFCIAIAYSFQVLGSVPFEETDIRPQMLVTEQEIIFPHD